MGDKQMNNVRGRRHRFAWIGIVALVLATLPWAASAEASANGALINRDPESYVLLAMDGMNFKGGNGTTLRGLVLGGNVGINKPDPKLGDNTTNLSVGANGYFEMSPGTQLVSGSIRLGVEARVSDVFVDPTLNGMVGTGWADPATISGTLYPIENGVDLPIVDPALLTTTAVCGPFDAVGTIDITATTANSPLSLAPGAYRDVQVQNGATLRLEAGTYTIRRFMTGQHTTIYTVPGTVIHIWGDENGNTRDFNLGDDGYFGSEDPAVESIATICVSDALRAGGLSNNNTVGFGQDGYFWGVIHAPSAPLNLGNNMTHVGRFVAKSFASDWNVNITLPDKATKSGMKFADLDNSGSYTAADSPLADWPIDLLDTSNVVLDSTVTAADGSYSFTDLVPGTYRVCEGAGPAGYVQTFPNAATIPPAGETVISTCPAPNVWGYEFTVAGDEVLAGNDFGNYEEEEDTPDVCQKASVQSVLGFSNGSFGNGGVYPGNTGPDVTVYVNHGESVQAAVDAASDLNGDGYIIIAVAAYDPVGGIIQLGGSANQAVVVSASYPQPFALIGCSVTLRGGATGPAVWIKSTAQSPAITVEGRTTTIFVMDLHGAQSAVGVQADGQYRYLRNEQPVNNGVGFRVLGNNNTIHNGYANNNTGDGVVVEGNGNLVTDADAFGNGGNGVHVVGDSNTLSGLDVGDRGKGNVGDGIHVVGFTNQLTENDSSANAGDGIDISGNGNRLLKNRSNTGTAGSDLENLGPEYRFANVVVDQGGNKKDGLAFTSVAIGAYE